MSKYTGEVVTGSAVWDDYFFQSALSYLLSIYFVVCNDEEFGSKKGLSQKRIKIENNIADIIFTKKSGNGISLAELEKVDSDIGLQNLKGELDIESLRQIHRLIKKGSEIKSIFISAPEKYDKYCKQINEIYKNEIKKIEQFMKKVDPSMIGTLSQPYLTIIRPEAPSAITYIKK